MPVAYRLTPELEDQASKIAESSGQTLNEFAREALINRLTSGETGDVVLSNLIKELSSTLDETRVILNQSRELVRRAGDLAEKAAGIDAANT